MDKENILYTSVEMAVFSTTVFLLSGIGRGFGDNLNLFAIWSDAKSVIPILVFYFPQQDFDSSIHILIFTVVMAASILCRRLPCRSSFHRDLNFLAIRRNAKPNDC